MKLLSIVNYKRRKAAADGFVPLSQHLVEREAHVNNEERLAQIRRSLHSIDLLMRELQRLESDERTAVTD